MNENTKQETDEIECPYCAEKIKAEAKKCKHCGEFIDLQMRETTHLNKSDKTSQDISKQKENAISSKSRFGALFWFIFAGALGAHRFYVGKNKSATLMILLLFATICGMSHKDNTPVSEYIYFLFACEISLVLWIFVDVFLILSGRFTDIKGKTLKKW